jgi:hypothetical protein
MAPAVYHYAPLHHLPFIARAGALLSGLELRKLGFAENPLRRGYRMQDERRAAAGHVHLTLEPHPRLLQVKLGGGFPHFEVAIPAGALEGHDYLIRYGRDEVELLVAGRVPIGEDVAFRFFDEGDLICARDVLIALGISAYKVERDPALSYTQQPQHRRTVQEVLQKALAS